VTMWPQADSAYSWEMSTIYAIQKNHCDN
jgi:hypothetical protein